ncbi:photosystem I assembly protein Ycf4 [Microcoleus sp. FACHB-831]|jgi:hypothetical protein|uniref:photosystem I assembly protein Ycf4 n=1 Tax=Microcoleus sp. FACHB-831 TaxID=2692827 RepID=UPI00168427D5|nr:photosystem I assembly protein Ycf4 [Microcoleus sp. FACHB-831]MBD1920958.1 photosystem I assembly protein Ycf4 [Microcoleus sp. FACHB-831]
MAAPTTSTAISTDNTVLRQEILGSRRFSSYFFAIIVSIGATGFLLAGISSYLKVNLLPFADPTQLLFIPQGIAMTFYGVAGILLALYLWLVILLNVGGGYNEFNRETGLIKIFRLGFWGKNRQIELTCKKEDVQAIRVDVKEGINPRRALYLRVKGRRNIPLTRVGQPIAITDLENQAAVLARFLEVPIEGL